MRYELLNTTGFLFTNTTLTVNLSTGPGGDGYAPPAALIGSPEGLRSWAVRIETLPDLEDYQVDAFARGKVTIATQPNNDDTMTVGGKTYTLKTASPSGDQILIGASALATAANIVAKVNADKASTLCTAENNGTVISLMATTAGAGGNSIELTTDGTRLTKIAFANGVMTRAEYLWEFWLRSKVQGNRPFWVEDPKDDLFYLAEFQADGDSHKLDFEIFCSRVYGSGLGLEQRRASDQATPVEAIPS